MTTDVRRPSRYLWWGKEGLGRSVYDAAVERVALAYDLFDHLWVSFSGGKDSTCVLNVALDCARQLGRTPLRVVFFDEEAISLETADYVRRVAALPDVALEWYCLPVRHRNACSRESPTWWPWAPEDEDRWVRPLPPEAITSLDGFRADEPEARLSIPEACPLIAPPAIYGNTAALLGIRADESLTRRKAVSNRREENWIIPTADKHYSKAYPVYDWSTRDVWTAPARLGWDYNETYDVMEMAGIPHSSQRCAPPFGEEPMQLLWMWAACFPDLWDRMVDRVPGAGTAARYSKTELYAFGSTPEPEHGQTWRAFIRARIEQHDPEVRAFIAHKIKTSIERHYSKTAEPILPHARHPISGMSWEWLYSYADRGDFKDRRQVGELIMANGLDKARAAYDAELAALRAAGRDEW